MRVEVENGDTFQRISDAKSVRFDIVDLSFLDSAVCERCANALVFAEARRAFDLTGESLLRLTLIRISSVEHVLLLTMHHIIFDGWSVGILVRELATLYESYRCGIAPDLSEPTLQYSDFSRWQHQWTDSDDYAEKLSYFKDRLAGAPAVLELPTDRSRPPVQSFRGAHYPIGLPSSLVLSLKDLGREEGVTLFSVLLAVFKTLLFRYTGVEDIIVGTPVANRNFSEIESLIGLFANTLVLRTDLSKNPTFRELLSRVHEAGIAAFARQDMPFEQLVEELQPPRNPAHNPIFQVMFSFNNTPIQQLELSGLDVELLDAADSGTSQFDLTIQLEQQDLLTGYVEYDTGLFDEATIARLVQHYHVLLEGAVRSPTSRLCDLPLLTADEYDIVLNKWARGETCKVENQCIHHLVEAQARARPDAIAIDAGEEQITYSELNKRANRLAHYLINMGVQPENCIGICIERSISAIVGLLGIEKAGGAYLPLDPSYPNERIYETIKSARARIVVTDSATSREIGLDDELAILLDTDWKQISQEPTLDPGVTLDPDFLSYVIYTSGTTGQPNGVMINHRSVVNLAGFFRYWARKEDAICTWCHSYAFDFSVWEIWGALANGLRLVPIDGDSTIAPERLIDLLQKKQVTHIGLTPSVWRQIATKWREFESTLDSLPLAQVLLGGESLSSKTIEGRHRRQFETWNFYGPTEATVWATCQELGAETTNITIGGPISNCMTYVLDESLSPIPIGARGEIFIGGAGLARGYFDQPHRTAEHFIPNPYAKAIGERLYRTGDVARLHSNGRIQFLERNDTQVKMRGFRVELQEIEYHLSRLSGVLEAAAVPFETRSGDLEIDAYLVVEDPAAASYEELRQNVACYLPAHMIPSRFYILDKFPQTRNGKIDRERLSVDERGRAVTPAVECEANSDIEKRIAGIWMEILNYPAVGMHDKFFDLGGNSFQLVQCCDRLRDEFNCEIAIADLFKFPTVSALSVLLMEKDETQPRDVCVRESQKSNRRSTKQLKERRREIRA